MTAPADASRPEAPFSVLIVNRHPSDVLGGSEMQCDLIARGLHARGHRVVYAAVGGRGPFDAPYPVRPLADPVGPALEAAVRELRPDVVYWRFNKHHLLRAARGVRRAGSRFVFAISHVSDTHPWITTGATVIPRGLDTRGVRGAARVAAALARAARARLNYTGFRLVDAVTSLNHEYVGRLPVRRQLAIHNAVPDQETPFSWPRPFVLWVANVKPKKNPDSYVELAARCGGLGVDFLMVGKIQHPLYDYLRDPARVPAGLHYLGPRPPAEVNGMLRQALFLVHTCDPEGFGNIFIQAWRAGRPTLTMHFDPEGLIASEGVGFISPTLDRLEADVRRLAGDEALRAELGARALRLGERFTQERMVDQVERFLSEVAGRRSAPARGAA